MQNAFAATISPPFNSHSTEVIKPVLQTMNTPTDPLRRSNAPAAFSLVELLGVIVLIGIISLGAYIYVGDASQQAKLNTKARNAQLLNQLMSIAAATGATIGPSASNNIDTSNITTAITSLNNGFTINGIPIKMNPPINIVNANSYTLTPSSGTPTTYTFASDGKTDTSP
jgi:prepilin-type N-terminal cleavage/methylation domain-containing protein